MELQYTHHDTEAKQERFLAALAEKGNVQTACAVSDVARSTVNFWIAHSESFCTRKKEAMAQYGDWLESRLHDMIQDPKTPKSSVVALLFALKGHLPHKYRDAVVDTTERQEASQLIAMLREKRREANTATPRALQEADQILAAEQPSP